MRPIGDIRLPGEDDVRAELEMALALAGCTVQRRHGGILVTEIPIHDSAQTLSFYFYVRRGFACCVHALASFPPAERIALLTGVWPLAAASRGSKILLLRDQIVLRRDLVPCAAQGEPPFTRAEIEWVLLEMAAEELVIGEPLRRTIARGLPDTALLGQLDSGWPAAARAGAVAHLTLDAIATALGSVGRDVRARADELLVAADPGASDWGRVRLRVGHDLQAEISLGSCKAPSPLLIDTLFHLNDDQILTSFVVDRGRMLVRVCYPLADRPLNADQLLAIVDTLGLAAAEEGARLRTLA
ncbi:MAG: hypothetical protein HYV63_31850 [Candidatus Schekmanbacteria bacterium]|nr:hypothetical protein [Candidatus Schekmanbacteria bacterium]